MLFILFGGTLEMGYRSRCYFRQQGFEIIQKYNYLDDDAPIDRKNYENPTDEYLKWFDDKVYVDAAEFEQYDFRYCLNGVHVGFNKQQILDAIHGKKNSLITLAASSIQFIEQIKRAYGDYVTVINLFIDHAEYLAQIKRQPGITPSEFDARMRAEATMGRTYLDKLTLFDDCVVYAGESTAYDFAGLEQQFASIIHRRSLIQKKLNNKKYVDLPYTGGDPYIFISYSHKDADAVYPILSMLQRNSFRIWYDDGLTGGNDWREIIAEKIESCRQMILFSSRNVYGSKEVGRELKAADLCDKNILVVSLDHAMLETKHEMYLDQSHKLYTDMADFEARLVASLAPDARIG